jgi:hypothetical protein
VETLLISHIDLAGTKVTNLEEASGTAAEGRIHTLKQLDYKSIFLYETRKQTENKFRFVAHEHLFCESYAASSASSGNICLLYSVVSRLSLMWKTFHEAKHLQK